MLFKRLDRAINDGSAEREHFAQHRVGFKLFGKLVAVARAVQD